MRRARGIGVATGVVVTLVLMLSGCGSRGQSTPADSPTTPVATETADAPTASATSTEAAEPTATASPTTTASSPATATISQDDLDELNATLDGADSLADTVEEEMASDPTS